MNVEEDLPPFAESDRNVMIATTSARVKSWSRTWLSLNRRRDGDVHFGAFLPSLIHCSAVRRPL